jgi:hypothetical protein
VSARTRSPRLHVVILCLALASAIVSAQYGHPMKGQWSGQWGPESDAQRLLLDLHWDGQAITGTINPGGDSASVRTVTFDYSDPAAWKVRLEAERKDSAGKPIRIVAEGTLENIGSYYRVFRGTWTEGGRRGPFTLTRN